MQNKFMHNIQHKGHIWSIIFIFPENTSHSISPLCNKFSKICLRAFIFKYDIYLPNGNFRLKDYHFTLFLQHFLLRDLTFQVWTLSCLDRGNVFHLTMQLVPSWFLLQSFICLFLLRHIALYPFMIPSPSMNCEGASVPVKSLYFFFQP